jgi:5-formyltetrahydrofolate cyclo-ligase
MDKSALRVQCRSLRDAMTAETVASASASIHHHLAAWPIFQEAQTVMAYMAFGNEINLVPLMEQFRDKRWVIPRTRMKPEPHLILHPYDFTRLVRHRYGMLEPDASLPVIEPVALDLVLVPGVAFDRRGYRLGYGGGFYGRFLPRVTATTVGIVYKALVVDQVPNDEFDQPVKFLACEAGICEMTRGLS